MSYGFLQRFLFSLDAELAHNIAMWAISHGLIAVRQTDAASLHTMIFSKPIPHPIGLAAGFDKRAVAINHWESLGFAFVEVGTVTPLPQVGNPKPRLFRLPDDQAIINRMGFNNDGARAMANRLEARETKIPIGVNIGKNRWTPNERAVDDYATCFRIVHDICDYVVINVSSPNTPGLRDLQTAESIKAILGKLTSIATTTPILVKLSPDAHNDDLAEIATAAIENGASGIVAVNTTVSRENIATQINEDGGLSGKPLRQRARDVCKIVRAAIGDKRVVIGVGGISTGQDANERLRSGADLLQIYTSFVYRGPNAVPDILDEMQQNGAGSEE